MLTYRIIQHRIVDRCERHTAPFLVLCEKAYASWKKRAINVLVCCDGFHFRQWRINYYFRGLRTTRWWCRVYNVTCVLVSQRAHTPRTPVNPDTQSLNQPRLWTIASLSPRICIGSSESGGDVFTVRSKMLFLFCLQVLAQQKAFHVLATRS